MRDGVYKLLNLKYARSAIISKYINGIYSKAVILSCGNGYKFLKAACKPNGIEVTGLSTSTSFEDGVQLEDRYYSQLELKDMYPAAFNATSGALGKRLMDEIGALLYMALVFQGYKHETLFVPVGSGETITALSLHIPKENLVGYYSKKIPAISFDYSDLKPYVKENFELVELDIERIEDAATALAACCDVVITS